MKQIGIRIKMCIMIAILSIVGFVMDLPIQAWADTDISTVDELAGWYCKEKPPIPIIEPDKPIEKMNDEEYTEYAVKCKEATNEYYKKNSVEYYIDGQWLYFINEDNTAKISGYYQKNHSIPIELSIPQTLNGRKVTEIDGLIGKVDAVCDDNTVQYDIMKIGGASGNIIPDGVESVVIPNTVKSIDKYTFWFCNTIKSFSLPDSITSIGDNAFQGCTSLESIDLPRNLLSIGKQAFLGCTALKRVSFPKTVTKIGDKSLATVDADSPGVDQVFFQCSDNLMVMIESTDDDENNYPGYYFDNLNYGMYKVVFYRVDDTGKKKVYAYKNSTEENWAKANGFEVIYYPDDDDNVDDEDDLFESEDKKWKYTIINNDEIRISKYITTDFNEKELTIPDTIDGKKVVEIAHDAFRFNEDLTKIIIGNNVRYIGHSAFEQCSNLKEVVLPNSLVKIDSYTFARCSSLEIITFPESIETISDNAFEGCISLKSIVIPKDVKSIDSTAFYGCTVLSEIVVDPENQYYNDGEGSNGIFKTSDKTLVVGCSATVIPNGTKSIAQSAFHSSGIKELIIPEGLESIGDYAFSGCSNLEKIMIPNSVTDIGESAFLGCISLESIVIPDSVIGIGEDMFSDCTSLKKVVLPNTLKEIGDYLFNNCNNLSSFEIPESVTSIGSHAFYNCSSLKNINIPDGVTYIGSYAFSGCNGITDISFPKGLKHIGFSAFCQCSELVSVTIPDSVTNIEDLAFLGCDKLKEIKVKSGSYAEKWALDNNYQVIIVDEEKEDNKTDGSDDNIEDKQDNNNSQAGASDERNDKASNLDKPSDTGNTSNQNSNGTNGNQSINNADQSNENVSKMADKGTEFSVAKLKGKFIVTSSDTSNPTVSYIGTTDKKVTSITIPDSVTFNNVTYKVTGISDKALSGNKKIKKLTIGKNVTVIGKNVFYKCNNLKTIIIKTAELKSVGKNAIKGINSKATIKVPKKQLKVYKKLFGKKTGFKKSIKIKKN